MAVKTGNLLFPQNLYSSPQQTIINDPKKLIQKLILPGKLSQVVARAESSSLVRLVALFALL